jgi:hypothetical protein
MKQRPLQKNSTSLLCFSRIQSIKNPPENESHAQSHEEIESQQSIDPRVKA